MAGDKSMIASLPLLVRRLLGRKKPPLGGDT